MTVRVGCGDTAGNGHFLSRMWSDRGVGSKVIQIPRRMSGFLVIITQDDCKTRQFRWFVQLRPRSLKLVLSTRPRYKLEQIPAPAAKRELV